jgi:hypothetical protein
MSSDEISNASRLHVVLWFQSSKRPDSILTIKKSNNQYVVIFTDKELNDSKHKIVFNEYAKLCEYVDLFLDNLMMDKDEFTAYEKIQWSIPGFPSIVISIDDIDDREAYRTLTRSLDFFLSLS